MLEIGATIVWIVSHEARCPPDIPRDATGCTWSLSWVMTLLSKLRSLTNYIG